MAALHLDNLLFLLFVALAIFFQILTRAATKGRRRPGDTSRRSTSPSDVREDAVKGSRHRLEIECLDE